MSERDLYTLNGINYWFTMRLTLIIATLGVNRALDWLIT